MLDIKPDESIKIDDKIRQIWKKTFEFAEKESDDIHTKIGCCIEFPPVYNISSLQIYTANKFLDGVKICQERLQRPAKYFYIEHAERNATIAVRHFPKTELSKAVAYCPYFSCADCARSIIATGIRTVAYHKEAVDIIKDSSWANSLAAAFEMFWEKNVRIVEYYGKIGAKTTFNQKEYQI